jgi:pSer/pThr/pTyr-binding forkhead associated (FHA) protein
VNAPIVVQAMRFGFLLLLWLFVFAIVRVVRRDITSGAPPPGVASAPSAPSPAARAAPPGPAPSQGPNTPARQAPTGPQPDRPRPLRQLVVTAGSRSGTTIPLAGQPITIGRAEDSTLVLEDDYVSTRHARISQRGGVWYVDDLGSTNGTFLGPTRVTSPVPAPAGTPIRIGTTIFELRP